MALFVQSKRATVLYIQQLPELCSCGFRHGKMCSGTFVLWPNFHKAYIWWTCDCWRQSVYQLAAAVCILIQLEYATLLMCTCHAFVSLCLCLDAKHIHAGVPGGSRI